MGPWVKALMGGQRGFTITDKFVRNLNVQGPVTGIWLGNEMPHFGPFEAYAKKYFLYVDLRNYYDVNGQLVDRLDSRILKPDEEEEGPVVPLPDSQISWDEE